MKDGRIYIPKGGMCKVCVHCFDDCSNLRFHEMKVINNTYPEVIVVKCSHFFKGNIKGKENGI